MKRSFRCDSTKIDQFLPLLQMLTLEHCFDHVFKTKKTFFRLEMIWNQVQWLQFSILTHLLLIIIGLIQCCEHLLLQMIVTGRNIPNWSMNIQGKIFMTIYNANECGRDNETVCDGHFDCHPGFIACWNDNIEISISHRGDNRRWISMVMKNTGREIRQIYSSTCALICDACRWKW